MLAISAQFPQAKQIYAKFPHVMGFIGRLTERPSFKNTAPPPRK